MKKNLFLVMIAILLAICNAMADDIVLADFDSEDPQPMVLGKWGDNWVIYQDAMVIDYEVAPNPLTDGYNQSPFCMQVGQTENAGWWANLSGIIVPCAGESDCEGILISEENHFLKIFVLRNINLVEFSIWVPTIENPGNPSNCGVYTNEVFRGLVPEIKTGAWPESKVGVWYDLVMDLSPLIGQHIQYITIVNSANWGTFIPTPATTFYYDNFVLSDNARPRDLPAVPMLQAFSDGFYIGFDDPVIDAPWYTDVSTQGEESSCAVVDNTPDAVNLTTKALEYNKAASATIYENGPLFSLHRGIPVTDNNYLHAFVKVPAEAIDPATGYCLVQLAARNWEPDSAVMEELQIDEPDVWQDIVLDVSATGMEYITELVVRFDVRYESGEPVPSPANTFYLDGIVLNASDAPRTELEAGTYPLDENGDIILANFDQPGLMEMGKWGENNLVYQTEATVTDYEIAPNPSTDGYNTSPFCMQVGQPEDATWWPNLSGIALPHGIYGDSLTGRGIPVTEEYHFLKMAILRQINLVPLCIFISTTEDPGVPGNSGVYTFRAYDGSAPESKVGVWYDLVLDLSSLTGQHLRSIVIINSANWDNPMIPTPATKFYYDNFVLSNNKTPRDVVIPPLRESSDGFYIGFEDPEADAEWYTEALAEDVLSSYSIIDNIPDNVNHTAKVMEYNKAASAAYDQSGPLFILDGGIPVTKNNYLHAFIKVPEGAIDPATGYCMIQLVAKDWIVDDGVVAEIPIFDPDVWQDIVLDVTSTGKEYITDFSLRFDYRLNQYGRPAASPANTFYVDGIALNDSAAPRTELGTTSIQNVKADPVKAIHSGKNTITVITANDAKITVLSSMGQAIAANQIKAGVSQQFNTGAPGVYIIVADTGTGKQIVKVLVF